MVFFYDYVMIFDIGLFYLNCFELERKVSVCMVYIICEVNGRWMLYIICLGEEKNVMLYLCLCGVLIWNYFVNL